MERYVGLDVHSKSTTVVVIGPSGRKLREAVVETTPRALIELVGSVRKPRVIVMEEGNQSDWLYEVLSPHANETLVVQPTRTSGSKWDGRDAEHLARLARLNEPGRLIYKSPERLTGLRHAAKIYLTTREDLTRCRARLKLLLQSRGLLAKSAELLEPDDREAWIEQLPEAIGTRARLLGRQLDAVSEVHVDAKQWLLEEARTVAAVRWVRSVPGIGDIRAPLIVATIISPHRFRTKHQLWRYSGLAVEIRSSSDWAKSNGELVRRRGHELALGLNRDRNPVLKEAFVGAAQQILSRMHAHPLHKSYQDRVAQGMRPNLARLTLARKLAAIVLAVWKRKEVYDPSKS